MKIKTIAIVTAMEDEANAICPNHEKTSIGDYSALKGVTPNGHQYICVISGIGLERAYHAASLVAEQRPDILLNSGVSGALNPDCKAGDIFAASKISSPLNKFSTWTISEKEFQLTHDLFTTKYDYTNFFCSPNAVTTSIGKKAIFESVNASAVDMESIAVANAALSFDIPFACIRAISDESDTEIPKEALVGLTQDGKSHIFPVISALITKPRLIRPMMKIGRNYKKALNKLSQILN